MTLRIKRTIIVTLALVGQLGAKAQESQTVFNFLRLPVSAHAAALGGEASTLVEDDAAFIFHNPALINNVTDRTLNLNMMTYMEGSTTASASFIRAAGERSTWGVSGQFMSYGSMRQTDASGQQTGDFSARDVAVGGSFAYALSNKFTGGISAKFVASYIGSYSSLGAAVDLGLNYYDSQSELSLSLVARNLGGQLSAYDDDFERMPLDLQLGVTKRLLRSPLRLTASLVRLNDWEYGLGRHIVVGADLILSPQFYVAAGYNALRAAEMKISQSDGDSAHGAGLSIGAGMLLQRLKLQLAYAKYHVSSSSILINLSYAL
jgi:hypothetical protein